MSKNLTRKGLALGAVVALGATVFAGSPAFAANEINVVPSAGTSYNAVAGTVFNLATTFAPGFTPSSYAQLKYQVVTDANSAVSYSLGTSALTSAGTSVAASTTAVTAATSGASATTVNYIGLTDTTTSVTSSVAVTAFVDANNNNTLDAGEWNTVKTVTFKKLADIVPAVSLTAASIGDTTVKATVAWGDLNIQQAGVGVVATGSTNSKLGVEFKYTGGSFAAATSYDSTTGVFSKSQSVSTAGDVVSAQAVWATNTYLSTPSNTYSSTVLSSVVTSTAAARTINTTNGLVANVLAGNDAIATAATTRVTNTAATVRANGSFTAQVKAYDTTAGTALAAPSVAVVGTVALGAGITLRPASTGVTEISVTVNGTKYTSNDTLTAATFPVTTDSTGVASVVVSSSGVTAGSTATITVTFTAQNLSAAVVATETAATYSVSESNVNDVYSTTPGATTALTYAVKDQFGQAIAGAYRVKAIVTGGTANTYYVNVAAGSATVNVADTQLATASSWTDNTVAATLEVQDAATLNWSTQSITVGDSTVIHYTTTANNFTSAPALDKVNGSTYSSSAPTKQSLTTAALADLVAPAAGSPSVGDATWARIALTGANVGGKYTVSASGAFIWANGKANAGSASVQASGAAEYVYIASNTTGTKTVTFVTGAVTKTVDVAFDKSVAVTVVSGVGTAAAGAKVAVGDLVALSQAGRSVDVSAVITDKFGNPLQNATVTLSATGVGYLANNGTTTSDASGKVTAKLIVGASETGDAVVTASANLGDSTVATASKTVSFGATDANIDIVGNRVTAVTSFSKGKTVSFYVDGIKKWSKVSASDADVVLNYNLKKGTHTVAVKISGGFSAVEKFIVK